jgi:hypothetical protein|nr:MAG TPA: hypothetical protein [Caudoviricetes sp.]
MSVSYFTKIVYGVRLENDEINILNQKDDEFCDKNCDFIHRANYHYNDEDIVIGIQVGDSVEEGTIREITFSNNDLETSELKNILGALNITREPKWYVVHCVL